MGTNTIIIFGHGPGVSHAVARRFGKAGHPVALVARNATRLKVAVDALSTEGIQAHAIVADLTEVGAVERVVAEVQTGLGPIGILHWNVFLDIDGDLLSTPPSDLSRSFDIRVTRYIAAVQASVSDLERTRGSVLVTSGVMALDEPHINAFATDYAALAIGVAAQRKATALLAHTLAPRGIHVAEVVVNGFVAGTPGGAGKNAAVEPAVVAQRFWEMHSAREAHSCVVGGAMPVGEGPSDRRS